MVFSPVSYVLCGAIAGEGAVGTGLFEQAFSWLMPSFLERKIKFKGIFCKALGTVSSYTTKIFAYFLILYYKRGIFLKCYFESKFPELKGKFPQINFISDILTISLQFTFVWIQKIKE
jgi:hypothetical protein